MSVETADETGDLNLETIRSRLQVALSEVPGIVAAYLFGSVATGRSHAGSDVDVAILRDQAPRGTLDDLMLDLESDLSHRLRATVQLVVLNRAPPELVHRVLRDGVLLIDRDPGRRIRFEVRARNEYFDVLPLLLRYRGLEQAVR
ncbi:MAG TPA: nucleotidyltransferase domain-containing protein [Thermoanaerobaculia bacterium]|nr:nucleotidyltransferase domain-containing protein [Thermoanaerobaculia bacterium]